MEEYRVLIRRAMMIVFAVVLALGAVSASAQRPGHGGSVSPSEGGTPVASETFGCGDLDIYMGDLEGILDSPGPFMEFVFSDLGFEELSAREARQIIEDGEAVVSELGEMEVPAPYQPGHDGIVGFLQVIIDYARFYALDSSQVPDILAYDHAMMGIYEGEVAIAEACPDEVEDIGGFVFFDPATLEEEYGDE